jgi:hypothetical protein
MGRVLVQFLEALASYAVLVPLAALAVTLCAKLQIIPRYTEGELVRCVFYAAFIGSVPSFFYALRRAVWRGRLWELEHPSRSEAIAAVFLALCVAGLLTEAGVLSSGAIASTYMANILLIGGGIASAFVALYLKFRLSATIDFLETKRRVHLYSDIARTLLAVAETEVTRLQLRTAYVVVSLVIDLLHVCFHKTIASKFGTGIGRDLVRPRLGTVMDTKGAKALLGAEALPLDFELPQDCTVLSYTKHLRRKIFRALLPFRTRRVRYEAMREAAFFVFCVSSYCERDLRPYRK